MLLQVYTNYALIIVDSRVQPNTPKFVDGQPVQLEDGTTAYIHSSHKGEFDR